MKNSFYLNVEKKLIDCSKSLDYSISDEIFLGYIISEKKNALYFNKNEFILEFLFKLSKKNEFLRIKECMEINLLDEFFLFNENYNNRLYIYN
jgi:hypothetical protein